MSVGATSTASSGPAGSHFEGQVGAFYLLSMLSGAPPRGLPETIIDRVALQQANMGRPLDDVIVHAHDVAGNSAVLEIQVKRGITFAPSDSVFREVVGQIVQASRRTDFFSTRYELAIAIAKGSRKLDGSYQEVLMLARQIGDAAAFMGKLRLAGAANDDMRTFVQTFRSHLCDAGSSDDDATIWRLLRRLQILAFDFTAPGSACEELARERVARVLHADDVPRAGALWKNLVELALDIAIAGGDRTREMLIASLALLSYRFAGERRHASARAALAEASRLALEDMQNRVGNVVLTRHERITSVNDALDHGRYVEIRGDAGVGKSGVLRYVADQTATEGQVIVLSPGRCVPRGWPAMRAQIGFDGTARELLVELANDGGATLFVDNLDSFDEEERLTAIDLVREASTVPEVSVVATVRPGFGIDEPSWIPADAIERLGKAKPVELGELSSSEIEQLTRGDPTLAPLLAAGHPARQVTRNLFRLSRLASQQASDPVPHTEVDMAEQWWKSADGRNDALWRDRSRLLQALAEQTLLRADKLDVKDWPSPPIDALIASGTLRNLGADRVAFRHDVFREWAIANAVFADSSWVDRLDLDRPAPATLARGIELAARMALERATVGKSWRAMVQGLSRAGAHQSWRRAALLALVRSEAGVTLLQRASAELLASGADLLRELIRTVMAVEVVPASTAFAAAGIDPALIPASLNVPRGPTWFALIPWLLGVGEHLPAVALPEVVDLYTTFSLGTLGATLVTPLTTRALYQWLRKMEPGDLVPPRPDEPAPWAGLEREQARALRADLRNGFLMFCKYTPELAVEYLQALTKSEHNDNIVRSIMKLRGSLAQAAPAEFADLTAKALIEKPRRRGRSFDHEREEPFTFLDHEFLPASPAQGPFFELLASSPKDGLSLLRKLVDHAVAYGSRGQPPGTNTITVTLADGERAFPWTQTYFWSRNSNYYSVTSALMALEAWAHRRIEAGDAFDPVLADVLGPAGSPAVYLLVAVDLIISHWPKSLHSAAGFLGCPELLCIDHTRQVHDSFEPPDFFGISALRTEPRGAVSAAELKRRSSRKNTLDMLIGYYAFSVTDEQRNRLVGLLQDAARRLGPPRPESTLGDPEFMVVHALNLADPANWPERTVTRGDGSTTTARMYMSPVAEQQHLQALRDVAESGTIDFATQSSISLAIDNPSRLSPEARSSAIKWAREAAEKVPVEADGEGERDGSSRMRKEAILSAAMMVMRDGDPDQRAEHEDWAREQFAHALQTDEDPAHQIRNGIRFNPAAIAFVGMIHALRHRSALEDVRAVLEVAARDNAAAAHGYGAAAVVLDGIDARLPRAGLRCAFTACIRPERGWDLPETEVAARAERHRQRVAAAIDAEAAWLAGEGPEPAWPAFPEARVHRKRRLRLQGGEMDEDFNVEVTSQPTEYANHQVAALWLRQTQGLMDVVERPWLRAVVQQYMPWTIAANGGGMEAGDEVDHPPAEWNASFFELAARCLAELSFDEVDEQIVAPVIALPDQQFFEFLADFQRSVDSVYFGGTSVSASVAVGVRSALATRLKSSRGWQRLAGSTENSIETHIGPAIAVLFFNDHHFAQSTRCYLFPKGMERVEPFLPTLEGLVTSGPSPFVALVLLNLLEVAPRPEHLGLLVAAGKGWLESYSDYRPFWTDYGAGRRLCLLIENIRAQALHTLAAEEPMRAVLDRLLAALVSLGVPEASRLEEALRSE